MFQLTAIFSFFLLIAATSSALPLHSDGCYRAAVLDHVQEGDPSFQKSVNLNLELYDRSARLAKQNGADIIVFPEGGLFTFDSTRERLISDWPAVPEAGASLCPDVHSSSATSAIHQLGCIAKRTQLFVAGQLLDVQPCSKSNDTKCPADGHYIFNTAILIGRNGTLLAKYHKIHLFGETLLNPATREDFVIVDTELGRLGLQICFDMIFATPGHRMAMNGQIDTQIFPTGWVDQIPFLAASQYQMAWSFAHRVNLLAADVHHPQIAKKGSGIYSGSTQQFETLDTKTRLLVATVPIRAGSRSNTSSCPLNATKFVMEQKAPITAMEKFVYNRMYLNVSETSLVRLGENETQKKTCYKGVCCEVEYQMDRKSLKSVDEFYLLATNRTKYGPFPIGEEFCALIHCPAHTPACTTIQSDQPLLSKFSYIRLEGHFTSNTTVYPSVIGSQHEVMKKENLWSYEKLNGEKGENKWAITVGSKTRSAAVPIGTVALWGRAYGRDGPYVQASLAGLIHFFDH